MPEKRNWRERGYQPSSGKKNSERHRIKCRFKKQPSEKKIASRNSEFKRVLKMSKKIIAFDGGGGRGAFSCFFIFLLSAHLSKIPCDLVIGSSVGAVLAAALALDFVHHPEMQANFLQAIKASFSQKNKEQPFFACKWNGRHKRKALEKVFGGFKLGDAKFPLAIVTARWRGKMRVFLSTRPGDADMDLVTLLDAATAPPYFFASVKIEGCWMIDGGVRHNTPVDLAVLCAKELWESEPFRIFNVGTRSTQMDPSEPNIDQPEEVGLAKCMKLGIMDTLMGTFDDTALELIEAFFGKDVLLRVEPNLPPSFSDVSAASMKKMEDEAIRVWTQHRSEILAFFRP
jgi:predicted acylesterase/phospholipase RssA